MSRIDPQNENSVIRKLSNIESRMSGLSLIGLDIESETWYSIIKVTILLGGIYRFVNITEPGKIQYLVQTVE